MPTEHTRRARQPSGAPAPAAGSGGTVSLKGKPAVSLSRQAGAFGQLRVNLNWHSGAGGGLFRRAQPIDLDLGCLWQLADGSKGVVQALGNAFGSLQTPPYVLLDGDDRSGTAAGGENLLVNFDQLQQIRRILVFAYIYQGTPAWDRVQAVITMFPAGAPPVEIRLDETSSARTGSPGHARERQWPAHHPPGEPLHPRCTVRTGPAVQLGPDVEGGTQRLTHPGRHCPLPRRTLSWLRPRPGQQLRPHTAFLAVVVNGCESFAGTPATGSGLHPPGRCTQAVP